jgi:hypothetical protein
MFIVTWLFDKLGYMPKIDVQVGVIKDAWPFPVPKEEVEPQVKKPTVKKATTRTTKKPAVAAKTTRTKKVK